MAKHVDQLLSGATVVTMNRDFDIYSNGAVAVSADTIVAVGDTEELQGSYTAEEVVDCQGLVIIPGLVNAHTHIPMTLFRGLHDDLRLDVWLGYLMPLEREFVTPDFVRLGARLAAAEMIRSGITTFADMYYYEEAIATEIDEIGMRALLGQTILIFPAPDASTYEEGLIRCRRFIETWQGHARIQPAVAPHAWYTATPELLRACTDLALAFDVPLHTHVSETGLEVENCRNSNHTDVVSWLQRHGMLNTRLLAAHCVHLDRSEMFLLKEANAGVAHCPTSNLKLASGIAQVSKMLEIGINLGIGTDGPASNNDLDMYEETRLAAILAKTAGGDPTVLPAKQALEAATIGGARALHMADVTGSLEAGKRADITVVDISGLHNQPSFRHKPDAVYSQLIYSAKANDVRHVLCDGRWLMRDRLLTTIDEAATKQEADQVARQIDSFVAQTESSPYNKLVFLAGVERQESFEVQIKVPISHDEAVLAIMESDQLEIVKKVHYRQFDTYFFFSDTDQDAAVLRYREDEFIDPSGDVSQVRARLTLIGEEERHEFNNAIMLSRSRFLADANNSLRFYEEYFQPTVELTINKDRRRWRIIFQGTEFAVNLDHVTDPKIPGYFLEIKSRTWSRKDAERKVALIVELLALFGVDAEAAERREYPRIVAEMQT